MSATQFLFCIAYLFIAGLLARCVFRGDVNFKFPSLLAGYWHNHASFQNTLEAQPKPMTFYHGTTCEKANEILKTGLWMHGKSGPAIWMGDTPVVAQEYAGDDGAVVVVQVDRRIPLSSKGDGVWTFNLPNSKGAYQEYYNIKGIKPIQLLDYDGKSIN